MVFDLAEFDAEGNVSILEVARRMRAALDVERVVKKFYREFEDQHQAFLELIEGIPDERQWCWYASVLLNRLMFIYFLQKKGFLDGGKLNYLRDKLGESQARGRDRYFSEFLKALFFEGFAKPEEKRTPAARALVGRIKYLNGGLFLPHRVEQDNPKLDVPDRAFANLFDLFDRYSWNLDDTPGGRDDEMNPDVLGYIFEKYINQKAFGAYYTWTEITEYLCERTIHQLILDAVNASDEVKALAVRGMKVRDYPTIGGLLLDLDPPLCRRLVREILPGLSVLDPACGSGAFLVAALKTLVNIYAAVIGKAKFLNERGLNQWLKEIEAKHHINDFIKRRIITDNLFGVDIMEEATEIARRKEAPGHPGPDHGRVHGGDVRNRSRVDLGAAARPGARRRGVRVGVERWPASLRPPLSLVRETRLSVTGRSERGAQPGTYATTVPPTISSMRRWMDRA
jgi:hypothetical protein